METIIALTLALGNDPDKNYRRRELPWYGLWNTALRPFEHLPCCALFPQYPLWEISPKPATRQEGEPGSDDVEMDHGFDPSAAFAHFLAQSQAYSPMSSSPTPPSSPLDRFSGNHPSLPSHSSPPHPPLSTSTPKESHRVTDFAILQLRNKFNEMQQEPMIIDVVIPIIVEIKSYHRFSHDDDDDESVTSCTSGLIRAQDDATVQVRYLFCGMRQPSVIAISGAGPFWTWRQFFKANPSELVGNKDDDQFVPSDEVTDPTKPTDWSQIYKIGSTDSNTMLGNIRTWGSEFLRPINPRVRVLKDLPSVH